ncbi:MAG: SGNH/GDSL hydrolase family protein [Candidatus Cryptobacteroides sp.]|nr:SGNH/GDSL hydrolase family protein [Bacteroidales bacterium]MDY3963803.1 SGNH/GDSL hydrolase family protein [Candidatus Cryptobacteroides sp.]
MKLFENKIIVSFGDSVMKGIVTESEKSCESGQMRYVISENSFTSICEKRLGARISNFGRFGNTVRRGLRDVRRHFMQVEGAQYALLEFGGNDSNHNWKAISENPDGDFTPDTEPAEFIEGYKELLETVRSGKCCPVILSLPPIDPVKFFRNISRDFTPVQVRNVLEWLGGTVNPISNWHEMYNLELYRLAASSNVPVIDITTCFLSRRNYSDYLCEDGMHPNEEGHKLISDAILSFSI